MNPVHYQRADGAEAPASPALLSGTGVPFAARTACPLCGSHRAHTLALRDGKSGEPLHTVACADCGLGRIDPLPTPDELAHWYTHQYRQDYKAAQQPALRHVLRAARIARDRWEWLSQRHTLHAGDRSLDIGASSGEFVAALGVAGLQATGIEPHQGYAGFAAQELGLDVRQGTLGEWVPRFRQGHADDRPTRFALVSLFHVFEHLVEPVAQLRELAGLLAPGGVLYLEVPDTRRMCAPHTLYFRAHTLHFTPTTLRRVAAAAGLDVVADNFDRPDNLRVLLRPSPSGVLAGAAVHGVPAADDLVAAQARRRWGPYLLRRVLSGDWLHKQRRRSEEKREAARLGTARAVLASVYDGMQPAHIRG